MPSILENVFTAEAVQNWSQIVREAWSERKTSPDGYLRSLPPPGQRLATGPWTPQEEQIFQHRIEEFRQHKWPLSYWGIFSLALPHRTGSQCRHFYKHSRWFILNEENASISLAATRACLEHHRAALAELWSNPIAQQIESRVDAWLRGIFSPGSLPAPLQKSAGKSTGKASTAKPNRDSGDFRSPPQHAKQGSSGRAAKPPRPTPAVKTAEQENKPLDQQKRSVSKSLVKKAGGNRKRAAAAKDDDSSEDEFIAGTLRKVEALPKPAEDIKASEASSKPGSSTAGAQPPPKRRAKTAGIKRLASGHVITTAAVVADELGDAESEIDKLKVIRLDKEKFLPGWAREVQPYHPPNVLPRSAAAAEGSVTYTSDILSFDFASLGRETFTGVIINAPLADNPHDGVTATQLATLTLPECLAADAIVCVWASKAQVGEAVSCMAKAWGCKYVENLTWVHLAPSGDVAKVPGGLTMASHSTLLMGRRGGGELELRHQRSPDVIVEPALGCGRFPDAVREMVETLLPEPKRKQEENDFEDFQGEPSGGSGAKKSKARFLEVAFHGAEPGTRPGWVKLVQSQQEVEANVDEGWQ